VLRPAILIDLLDWDQEIDQAGKARRSSAWRRRNTRKSCGKGFTRR
jgi:hypothetical protein